MEHKTYLICLLTIIGFCSCSNETSAIGGYWKPVEGQTYTATFTDEANNIIIGKFKNTVRWQWEKDDSTTITEWDDEATFTFKDKAGNEKKIDNARIKSLILILEPGMVENGTVMRNTLNFTGKLKGNIYDVFK